MLELHPEILRTNGTPQFAVIAWAEYLKLQEFLEDAADLMELRRARAETAGEPTISFEQLKAELDER